jgi:hypothetical protein
VAAGRTGAGATLWPLPADGLLLATAGRQRGARVHHRDHVAGYRLFTVCPANTSCPLNRPATGRDGESSGGRSTVDDFDVDAEGRPVSDARLPGDTATEGQKPNRKGLLG